MDTKSLILQVLSNKTKIVISLIFSAVFLVSCEIFAAVLLKQIIEIVIIDGDQSQLPVRMTIFVIALITAFIFSVIKKHQVSKLNSFIFGKLANEAYTSILEAEMAELSKNNVKRAMSHVIENCQAVSDKFFKNNLVKFFERVLHLTAIFIAMMAIKPVLGLIVYASLVFFYISVKSIEKHVIKIETAEEKKIDDANDIIYESLDNIKDIKLLNGINYEKEKFGEWTNQYAKNKLNSDLIDEDSRMNLQNFFVGIIFSIVLGLASWLSSDASFGITAGTITVYVIFVPIVFVTFKSLMNNHISLNFVEEARQELDLLYSLKSEIKSEPVNSLEDVHSLKFIDVDYALDKKNILIDKVSFELKRGERLGILSEDIHSKRLIFEMLTKLTKATRGSISINNCDILKLNTRYLRDLITSIYAESTIFRGSILENIIYPEKFDEYKYNDALNRSGLKEIINELPNRERTIIDERTTVISKDAMQRIIFANAFYKDSKIYLLDDATKFLDINTENELLNEVFKLKNKIIIMMTDKVYNLNLCDKILILENGKVTEYGKYTELLLNKESKTYKIIKKASLSKKEKVS